jgi:hypothetical protein
MPEFPATGDHENQGAWRRFLAIPFVPFALFLLVGALFLPRQPWQHMTETLVYDVISAISTVIITESLHGSRRTCNATTVGSNPLGSLNYNPADDPYYVSNLDQPVDDFIASALEGTEFTNVVHIILESMREDSFPFQEDGLLNQHIINNLEVAEGGTPINTQTITPFIASLAENTISWHTVWSTIPYTHKAMLGRNLPLLFL